ncbi:pterin-4-alpha-carbinolamine dehydratase [Duganella sp. CF517]|uniref:4a-hydroxytetrahydrobiopterin dehydratase n=1 Tax=Duganella sp. CF517 TaxID=1881038 RepID=UPI0008B48672|nr:4a-hydroxytetrahydrobiopterin dehydratase [Duganella sp. CF517]SEO58572.1 pterin-4-alpha-carbinolamine dehydratase [Duganella sp. CF517]
MTTRAAPATRADLLAGHSRPARLALTADQAARLLALVPDWSLQDGKLCRTFGFRNYYRTMAFVNALAYLSHAEDHHPEMTVTYKNCTVRYDTHSVDDGRGGLSDNDFICAAKADALFAQLAGASA